MKPAVVVLISGSGSNLQALIDQSLCGALDIEIKAVISNKADAYGLERAKNAGIPTHFISHKDFDSRESFDGALKFLIEQYTPNLVVLAGFMRILTEEFTRSYEGKMLNIHPSLLPKFKGLDTHKRAIEAGESEHGVSVHFVSAELDAGAVIIQARTNVETHDTPESLAKKVHALEHKIYPLSVSWFAQKRITYNAGKAFLDNIELPETGVTYHTDLK
ncbi:phosphoribosylglycinamide formyltransferase [Marinomonas balearica]|uniref:Phosphoribosylglycinamide formyltransferase n=1 Tax=Marinomonas balearica TaxID=491947 RepID=A0A4R6MEL8_9GAMM|nr:phosphoribosylglycinamide formyltransferase [Marinomonas balearica]TDO99695.1 phosphoribosylglycinamide formyltransferase-1 [Marinomonas balearica]